MIPDYRRSRTYPPRPDNRAGVRGIGGPIGVSGPRAPNPAPSPFTPQAQTAILPYVDPTARIAQERGALNAAGADVAGIMQQRAATYAQRRLAALRRIAGQLSPELQQMLGASGGLDPAQAWRDISSKFADYAHTQGYVDPRTMLATGRRVGPRPNDRAGGFGPNPYEDY